uniref:CCHC-type domain-containing protein n=1 Tax=Trichogramma kaykai TaxID=54128 RepID=A0ABD2WD06_9HYME
MLRADVTRTTFGSRCRQDGRPAKAKPAGCFRPGVVVVKAKDPKSYAKILKLLRSEPTLKDSVSSVNKVRRSAGGELLLQLDKACISPGELGRKLDSAIGELGSATARTSVTAIEIKDLDEVTTREEIWGALRTHLDGASKQGLSAVRSLLKAFAGTQISVVTLPDQLAAKAVKLGRIRIGWVNCRIREKNEVRRCYRCWDPGHMAARCPGPDRRSCCHRCGQEGHLAKICQNVPSCLLCRGDEARTHATMSAAYPLAKKFVRGTK